ncbi:MAG: hypothetical protein Q8R33_05185 [Burkholderiales bacterium]|nr:hypothetical protein [Burkholderiales bacterium]
MDTAKIVTVYNFSQFEIGSDTPVVSGFKAQRQAIAKIFKGQVLEGTAEEVPESELDQDGRFRRVATGWGSLN